MPKTQGKSGFVKTYRTLLDWEWFDDPHTAHLWQYILLRVNYEPSQFKGLTIDRGQMLESVASMAAHTGMSVRQTRTALSHLESTGEVTRKVTRHGSLITVHNYAVYQGSTGRKRQTD